MYREMRSIEIIKQHRKEKEKSPILNTLPLGDKAMTTSKRPETPLTSDSTDSLYLWWYQPWGEAIGSAVKIQGVWLETCNDVARHELEFLSTMATSCNKLTNCMLGLGGQLTLASMASCYHEIGSDMAAATSKRARMVSELSDEFIERIWREI